jgi:transposase
LILSAGLFDRSVRLWQSHANNRKSAKTSTRSRPASSRKRQGKRLIHDPADCVYIVFGWIPLFAEDWLMIRISLPDPAVRQLECLFQTTSDAVLRRRIQIVLMAHRGRKHSEIAADTGTTPRSVQRWLNAYLTGGLDQLRPRKAKGAKPKLTADLAPILRQWVIDGPAQQRLDRANWTYAELADHLLKAKGVRIGKTAMQAFGAKHGIRPYRPTYRFLRGDPAQQAKAREELADLKKGRKRATSSS